ncbi:MAG TPA: TonB family protein [Bryobacteraceae bacterium]|nr:TonB family protein [Bryobacteraceae bacterium]
MRQHGDILDQPDPLGRWLVASIIFHVCMAGSLALAYWTQQHNRMQLGDLNGGGIGSVAVTPVASIPLPSRSGPVNPVANPTESRVPEPVPKEKPKPEVKEPPPDAIPLKSRNVPKQPSRAQSAPNKYRAKQIDPENQLHSTVGQAMVSPMYQMPGSGGVGIGNNSPFGQQFGWYANLLKDKVARNWRTSELDPRLHSAPQVVVTFTIGRDGSVPPSSVRIEQKSGNAALDYSAQRAILDSIPFPPLPPGLGRSSADIEFVFELRR